MNKKDLLDELSHHQYVMIRPSSIHGIGVFASRLIPKGTRRIFSEEEGEWITLDFDEVSSLPEDSRYMIETYCLFDESVYYVPANGFKKMDLSLFLNHSDQANLISIEDGAYFEAIRDIFPGEELLVDYGNLVPDIE
jgi:SET domain-containing protein